MKLAFVVVLCTNLPTSKLPAFVEAVDGVEGAKHGLEVDVDDTVFVALVELYMLDWAKLHGVSTQGVHDRLTIQVAYLVAECFTHVLADTAVVAIGIGVPVDSVYATPSDHHSRLFAKLARLVLLIARATTDIPHLL